MSRVEEARRRYNLIGGSILTVAGLALLSTSFLLHSSVPLYVRAAIIVFTAVAIAIAAGLLKVQNPQDVYGGMALILLALIALIASNELPGMRGFAFGPGTAPRLFAWVLAALSTGVVVTGVLTPGPDVSRYAFRGVIFIIGSIVGYLVGTLTGGAPPSISGLLVIWMMVGLGAVGFDVTGVTTPVSQVPTAPARRSPERLTAPRTERSSRPARRR